MTQTTFATPRLERPRGAPFRGVCTALARTTGTDPVLWRVLVVVLTFFGGLGAVLYLAGVVTIPAEGEQRSLAERLLHGPDRRLGGTQLALVVLLAVGVLSLAADADGLLALAALGGLAVLWLRDREQRPLRDGVAADGLADADPAVLEPFDSPYVEPAYVARPPRRRSPLTGVTASLAAVVAGLLLLLGTGDRSVPAEVVLAAALGVVALGLLAGAWWGRSAGLVLLAGLLGLGLAATLTVRPVIDHGVGERTWTPAGAGSYRLGVGEATLDLRAVSVREASTVDVDARVDVGHLLVLVPDRVRVSLDARADLGEVDVLGVEANGRDVTRQADLGPAGRPQLRLDVSVRNGLVEVRRG